MLVECQSDIQSFGQDISELRNVSTTKHPASVMMLGVVASNGEKMPPVWFPRGYRLTAAAYKDVLVTKILPWVRKITRNANYVFQQDGAPAHTANIVQEWLGSNMNFWPKDFWPHSRLTWTPSTTTSGRILRAKPVKLATAAWRSWSFSLIVHRPLWEKISSAKFARVSDLVWAVSSLLKEVALNNIIVIILINVWKDPFVFVFL